MLVILVLVAVGVGGFFTGRTSVSSASNGAKRESHPATASFEPVSVTFASLDEGWSLGTASYTNDGACLTLLQTKNQGHSWTAIGLPATLLATADRKVNGLTAGSVEFAGLSVRFANSKDGWIYGTLSIPSPQAGVPGDVFEPILWSTHDGGSTWTQQPLGWIGGQGMLFDLEPVAGSVYAMAANKGQGVTVESSAVGVDSWHVDSTPSLGSPAGGGLQTGSFVFNGTAGWLVEGNDRGTTGSARLSGSGRWKAWTPPCMSVGDSFAVPAASTPNDLVAVCTMGGFALPLSKSAPPGATLGSNWLYLSNNAGGSFTAGSELRPIRGYYDSSVLASPVPGVILLNRDAGSGQDLIASFDGGVHWSVVYQGQLFYLGFTSATQGVGIVRSAKGATSMVMTFDGGRSWSTVAF